MCEMRVVIWRDMLGERETGWTMWLGNKIGHATSNKIKQLIKAGEKVCGLTLNSKNELVLDKDGWFCTNLMEYRSCGNFKPMIEEGCLANVFYIVIGSHEENGVTMYDAISTQFEKLSLSESDVKAYLKIGVISGGCREKDGKIELASLTNKEQVKEEPKPVVIEDKAEVKKPEAKTEVAKKSK